MTLKILKKLDDDTAKLVEQSNAREEALVKIDIKSIERSKPDSQEVKLFSAFTNAACGALKPPSASVDEKRSQAYEKKQSEALTTFFMFAAIISLLAVTTAFRRTKTTDDY